MTSPFLSAYRIRAKKATNSFCFRAADTAYTFPLLNDISSISKDMKTIVLSRYTNSLIQIKQ